MSALDREMYSEAEAARYLRVPQSTLHYWLEGGERRSTVYAPVIRPEPTERHAAVTWAEFIEAGLLRSYRSTGIPMAELRAFIDLLRQRYQVPYPLADRRPFVSGRELVLRAQEESALDPDFWLVATVRGQLLLLPASDAFVRTVTWDRDAAVGWRPHDGPASPVQIDPDLRHGRPAVGGSARPRSGARRGRRGSRGHRRGLRPDCRPGALGAGLRDVDPGRLTVPVRPPVPGRRYKPATVRFYFDADVLGLAHVLAGLRPDVTDPGDPGGVVLERLRAPCPITSPATKDHVWNPQVTALGWVIVTRDSRIQDHRAEVGAVRDSGARMVALGGQDARGTFDQLEVFMSRWRAIEGCLDEQSPFIYVATRTTFRRVELAGQS